ncbi:MAG: CarD family transcriptional regulator [Actinomycetota bacterium]|nr:CarD family transcriptional regulator [Actinomycetota bacterium]
MHRIGDKVYYPYFGIGTVQDIIVGDFQGHEQEYYVIDISPEEMKVMIPIERAESVGLRRVISSRDVPKVLRILEERNHLCSKDKDYYKWYANCLEKIESSNILEVAEAVADFLGKRNRKNLSLRERELLKRGLYLLSTEIAWAKKIKKSRAKRLILESWKKMHSSRSPKY